MALVLNSVLQLGTLDSTLSLHQHVVNVCSVAYLELRCINSIRNLLSIDVVETLVCSLVLSHIDYCNSLLVGLPQFLIKTPQGVQNQYIEYPDLSTSHHSSRTFTGYLSIGESCTRLLHYVIHTPLCDSVWGMGLFKIRTSVSRGRFSSHLRSFNNLYTATSIYMALNTGRPVHHLDCVPLTTSSAG